MGMICGPLLYWSEPVSGAWLPTTETHTTLASTHKYTCKSTNIAVLAEWMNRWTISHLEEEEEKEKEKEKEEEEEEEEDEGEEVV